jgi:predicted nuclease with TOPRIM domain
MPGESVLQSLQKFATIVHRLDALTEEVRDLRTAAFSRIERLEGQMAEVRERLARLEASHEADLPKRVARLEASRAADRAQMQADLARFKAEVERAEFRIARLLPAQAEPPALPEDGEEEA